tara:strand:- start:424 stop:783 length:360 start_codon:yes stop_codon:yes gene_type:complete
MNNSIRFSIWDAIESLRPGSDSTYDFAADTEPLFSKWDTEKFGNPPTLDEIKAETVRLNAEHYPLKNLRFQRNQLLAETDYLALSDATLSADMQTYRQALRDLPANTSDPANPTWPVKP